MAEVIGSTYELIEKLGSGGGGSVYLANHLRLEKKVVLKRDKRKVTIDSTRLRREVDVLKDLSHPRIPQVYDFFIEDGNVYTVMEYVNGESLDKALRREKRFSQAQVIKWAIQFLEALSYLHSPTHGAPPRGYVHSDIKPANLMRTQRDEIYLIDFNISLAIGEETVIGHSEGYASPEYYGFDFSSGSGTRTVADETSVLDEGETMTLTETLTDKKSGSSSSSKKLIMPDARSDIYSVGATIYHLLSGVRPAKYAMDVVPLSEKEFSPQIVDIVTKAMNPNPNLRFQTAEEMLYAFTHLRENDIRVKRSKRNNIIAAAASGVLLLCGISSTFLGLKRMQITENWLKLAEYSQNALARGDTASALDYALSALPKRSSLLTPPALPEVQLALTSALGVYDLADGFKEYKTVELSSEPLFMSISPDGRLAACISLGTMEVFDTDSAEILVSLPADSSALSEVEFLDNHTVIFASEDGIQAYDIEKKEELWSGGPATAITISHDGSTAAGVYRDETFATVYDTSDGKVKFEVDFDGKSQRITINDNFANARENVFELNGDGTLLSSSFDDGSLQIFKLKGKDKPEAVTLLKKDLGYTHYEGGFYENYFAFAATKKESSESIFATVDSDNDFKSQGAEVDYHCGVQTDENGIYLKSKNILVQLDPVTGEQTPLVDTTANIAFFARSDKHTMVSSDEGLLFFDNNAQLITEKEKGYRSDLIRIVGDTALTGRFDSPVVNIMKYENHSDSEIFAYDPSYKHVEARVRSDEKGAMLFSRDGFRLYDMEGKQLEEVPVSDSGQVYDQQYVREEGGDILEVIYKDGKVYRYSTEDGTLLDEEKREKPDETLYEEFTTDNLRIEAPKHDSAKVYKKDSDKQIGELKEEAYLTYVNQAGDFITAQYYTSERNSYGYLLNEKCEKLAELPCLCDIVNDKLIFDYPTGNLREAPIYELDELISLARRELDGADE